jgi:hypothetical protein
MELSSQGRPAGEAPGALLVLQAQYRSRDTTVLLASHLRELCLIDGRRMRFGCGRLVPRARPNHDFHHISALCALLGMEQGRKAH